jgi:hypothetical protein
MAYGLIREKPLLSTTPDLLLAVLKKGTVSTNVYLRRIQNFALDMGWLPWPILRKKQFPKVRFKPKRGITEHEHRRIIGRETNPERAYAKNAAVTIPSLDEWEELVANKIIDINQMPKVA